MATYSSKHPSEFGTIASNDTKSGSVTAVISPLTLQRCQIPYLRIGRVVSWLPCWWCCTELVDELASSVVSWAGRRRHRRRRCLPPPPLSSVVRPSIHPFARSFVRSSVIAFHSFVRLFVVSPFHNPQRSSVSFVRSFVRTRNPSIYRLIPPTHASNYTGSPTQFQKDIRYRLM